MDSIKECAQWLQDIYVIEDFRYYGVQQRMELLNSKYPAEIESVTRFYISLFSEFLQKNKFSMEKEYTFSEIFEILGMPLITKPTEEPKYVVRDRLMIMQQIFCIKTIPKVELTETQLFAYSQIEIFAQYVYEEYCAEFLNTEQISNDLGYGYKEHYHFYTIRFKYFGWVYFDKELSESISEYYQYLIDKYNQEMVMGVRNINKVFYINFHSLLMKEKLKVKKSAYK